MAEAMGDTALAEKYRAYAERIRGGMLRMLAVGPDHDRMWRVARNSVLPSLQDCLVQAWFSLYREGLDPQRMDEDLTPITRPTEPTLRRYPGARHGIRYRVADPLGAGARPNGQCRTAAGQHRPLHVRQKHELRRQHARDRLAKMDVDHPRRGEHHARRPLVPHLRPEQRS